MRDEPAAGDVLKGRVRLVRRLGFGGFSSVWRGFDVPTQRHVAIKILHPEHEKRADALRRFQHEAELLARLEHPSIARAFDAEVDTPPRFFTLEYVDGQTLQARITARSEDAQPIPLAGIGWLVATIADALAYAHNSGVVHRDLKPANVMVNAPHQPAFAKVLDFGAAKTLGGAQFDPTTVGRVIGSIAYMAPEQLRSRTIDGRTDQFALAVLIFEMLTLRRPWALDEHGELLAFHLPIGDSNSQHDLMRRIVRGVRPRARDIRTELTPTVDRALSRALSPDPEDRFETIGAFADALRLGLLESQPSAFEGAGSAVIESGAFEDAAPTRLLGSTDAPVLDRRMAIRAAETAADRVPNDLEATEDDLGESVAEMTLDTKEGI